MALDSRVLEPCNEDLQRGQLDLTGIETVFALIGQTVPSRLGTDISVQTRDQSIQRARSIRYGKAQHLCLENLEFDRHQDLGRAVSSPKIATCADGGKSKHDQLWHAALDRAMRPRQHG